MPPLRTTSDYRPMGDQAQAIETLAASIEAGEKFQTLVGATVPHHRKDPPVMGGSFRIGWCGDEAQSAGSTVTELPE